MIESLLARRERWGMSYVGIPAESAEDIAPIVSKLTGT